MAQQEFQAITAASDEDARAFLAAADGNIQLAISRFFDTQDASLSGPISVPPEPAAPAERHRPPLTVDSSSVSFYDTDGDYSTYKIDGARRPIIAGSALGANLWMAL